MALDGIDRQWRRRAGDQPGQTAPTETRVSVLEVSFADHQDDCKARQTEIKGMFAELKADIKAMSDRVNGMQFGWMATALSLVGSAALFLFGKVMRWW